MEMAKTLKNFLEQQGVEYELLMHRHTDSSVNSAHAAHVPESQLAKPVILEDMQGYVMAVIPADHHVKIGELNRLLDRNMGLATESEIPDLFTDCEPGAVPPVGQAYGMQTIVDNSLDACSDIYFESGNHEQLVHMDGVAFGQLMKNARHASICSHQGN
ncbi:MAG: YbaK/EbsC family protein [Pseudomonadota bacterium]